MDKSVNQEALASAAFDRVLPELKELRDEDLLTISLDIPAAVYTVLGTLKELGPVRELIEKELPSFALSQLDNLQDYALALSIAHARCVSAAEEASNLETLAEEATELRERLLAEVRAFTYHDVFSEEQLKNLKGGTGRKNIASDLLVLTSMMQDKWPELAGKTPTTRDDLERASRVSTRLGRILGEKEQGPSAVAQTTENRQRAYTKLMTAYEAVQRAVYYLRGARYDSDTIVPNLHPGRPGARKKNEDVQTPPVTTVPNGSGAPGASTGGGTTVPSPEKSKFFPNGPFMPSE
jgi:hypothetical protein